MDADVGSGLELALEGSGGDWEWSPELAPLRPLLPRFDEEGCAFSSGPSDDCLFSCVNKPSMASLRGKLSYPGADMADLPLPFLERAAGAAGGSGCSTLVRLGRVRRSVGGSGSRSSGCWGLGSRADALRFLDEPARGGAGVWLEEGGDEPDGSLAEERVTLDDMRNWLIGGQLHGSRQTSAPVGVAVGMAMKQSVGAARSAMRQRAVGCVGVVDRVCG